MDAITLNLCPDGIFIRCPQPLRLNQVFDLTISIPSPEHTIEATAEVIWSNRYGPDDEITPRGMGARFTKISGPDRKLIAKATLDYLKAEKIDPDLLDTLEILVSELD
jgi:hypothetical protein